MFKNQNDQLLKQEESKQTEIKQRLPYQQPEVHFLGSVEKVQANYQGGSADGPHSSYWYHQ